MSLFTYSINQNLSTQFNVSHGFTDWVLGDGVSIKSQTGHGIYNASNYVNNAIVVRGLIEANTQYKSGVASDADHTTVDIRATGNISGYNAVAVYGKGTFIYNAGTLSRSNIAIYTQGSNVRIENTASVAGKTAIYIDKVSTFDLSNMGSVSGGVGVALKGSAGFASGTLTNGATGGIQGDVAAIQIDSVKGDYITLNNDGGISSKAFAIAGGEGVETVVNTGSISGKISLGGGNDFFDNRGGVIDSAIDGGQGDDTYFLGGTSDRIKDTAGNDTVNAAFTCNLATYATIENLTLSGTGNNNGTGNALANVIYGNLGNNVLDGGIDNILDTLRGDAGNDTYVLGAGVDNVVDLSGIDTITSTITRSLNTFTTIENLKLLGSSNINGTGNALANTLTGNSGNNVLDGGVDAAIDTLKGGAGNDTYILSSGTDQIIDTSGTDTITSTVSRNLVSYSTIENLNLLGTLDITGTGNTLANKITGNSGSNALNGAAGNDVLVGGAGADKLDGGSGTDTASYTGSASGLTANLSKPSANTGDAKGDAYVSIENLTGSSHNDTLTGNTGSNVLTGGTGADKMTGGTGADTFLFKSLR
ncbi:calcium-binding protein (plasmid) [Rhizobium sp. RCAM05350]|nr:calcium-binding protein [Rhizobium sp. RCAM05350]